MNVKRLIKLLKFRKKWRAINLHNSTFAKNLFDEKMVHVGYKTYGPIEVYSDVPTVSLKIGNFCSIGPETIFILGKDHPLGLISTYPFKYNILQNIEFESTSKGDIIVGDDVWFGYRTIVLSGVEIGQGAVIAAGAVVTKDVPPYAIVGGNPARVLKYRFSENVINQLLRFDFSSISEEDIHKNESLFYTDLNEKNALEIIKNLSKVD